QRGGPVEDDGDGNQSGVAGWRADEESPAVAAGDVVRALRAHARGDTRLKQFRRRAKQRTRTNLHGHELLVQREVEHLTAICAPARLVSPQRGDGPLTVRERKGLDTDFKAAR